MGASKTPVVSRCLLVARLLALKRVNSDRQAKHKLIGWDVYIVLMSLHWRQFHEHLICAVRVRHFRCSDCCCFESRCRPAARSVMNSRRFSISTFDCDVLSTNAKTFSRNKTNYPGRVL